MSILIIDLYYVQVIKNKYYEEKVVSLGKTIVFGETAPRGRIYDRNGNVLVDNIAVKTIYYKKPAGVREVDEISLAYKIGK